MTTPTDIEALPTATEAALCCMIISNPGGGERPHAWQKRVNDLIRAQRDALTALQAERDAAVARAEAAENAMVREPYIVKIGPYHGICIGGRWDNWMFHMSASGQWVSQQKLSTAALTPPADLTQEKPHE
jgi:hypothetical protein